MAFKCTVRTYLSLQYLVNVVVRHQEHLPPVSRVQPEEGLLHRARDGRVEVGEADGPDRCVAPGVRLGRLESALTRQVDVVAAGLLRQDDHVVPHLTTVVQGPRFL